METIKAVSLKKNPGTRIVKSNFLKEMKMNGSLYIMAVPAMILLLLFCYLPMFGLIVVFKNFDFQKGIFGSDWATPLFNNFDYIFTQSAAYRAVRNTILLNALFITAGVTFEVSLALLFNEIVNKHIKKLAQTLTFLPFFISWIVVGVFAYSLLNSDYGVINGILKFIGLDKVDFYGRAELWPAILTVVMRWKNTGYGAIIYMATLSGIEQSYYEAAQIDGATRWQQIRYISLPMLRPTVVVLTLLAIGRIMNADFGMFYALVGDASQLYPTTDVIDTFVYRGLREIGDVSMASASGFLQSIVSFVLVLGSNLLARKIDKDAALF